MQNIPSEKVYRECFTANDFINTDYSSQESRIIAEKSGDQNMIDFFVKGNETFGSDLHSFTATKMYRVLRDEPDLVVSKKTHPEERNNAKALGFKLVYGGSAFTLKDDFGVDIDVAEKFIEAYLDAFPGLRSFFSRQKKNALRNGYVDIDRTGRRWYCPFMDEMNDAKEKASSYYPEEYRSWDSQTKQEFKDELKKNHPELKDLWSTYFTLRGKLERAALNYAIQGAAGSMSKQAGILIRRYLLDNPIGVQTNIVHDETCAESEQAEILAPIIKQCMEDAGKLICDHITMTAEPVISLTWQH